MEVAVYSHAFDGSTRQGEWNNYLQLRALVDACMPLKNSQEVIKFGCLFALCLCARGFALGQQVADPNFDAKVAQPAYAKNGPRVLFDEAHNNFHTAGATRGP